jgi:hypothetical protein
LAFSCSALIPSAIINFLGMLEGLSKESRSRAKKLYYVTLNKILETEENRITAEQFAKVLPSLLRKEAFNVSLFSVCLEVVISGML